MAARPKAAKSDQKLELAKKDKATHQTRQQAAARRRASGHQTDACRERTLKVA